MKKQWILLAAFGSMMLGALSGCDGSTPSNTGGGGAGGSDGGAGGTGGAGGAEAPPPPPLGEQIDRMGRPAINTAANATFSDNPEAKDAAKDAWNANADSASWVATHAGEVAKNLAILDSLDTVCGNQLLAAPTLSPTRYQTLAGVLADDRLFLNTDATDCTAYLAVEADAVGILPNDDCGGRTLKYDVIETSYSALAAGAISGIDDDVPISTSAGGETFPFVIDPN